MLAGALMSRNPVTVGRDHTLQHVTRVMKEQGVGAVVVVDESSRPIGICTDRDIAVRAFGSPEHPGAIPVDRIMTKPVLTVDEDTLLFDLLRLMAKKRVRRIPVVHPQSRAMVGLVSMDDVILFVTTELGNIAEVLGHSSRVLGTRSPAEEE
jgi:CBS domain-containing protein